MAGAQADLGTKAGYEIFRQIPVYKMAGALLGGEAHDNPKSVLRRDVEKRARRHRMRDPNGIDSERGHLGEITLNQPIVGIFATSRIRTEGAVSNAAHKERLTVHRKKLTVNRSSVERRSQHRIR